MEPPPAGDRKRPRESPQGAADATSTSDAAPAFDGAVPAKAGGARSPDNEREETCIVLYIVYMSLKKRVILSMVLSMVLSMLLSMGLSVVLSMVLSMVLFMLLLSGRCSPKEQATSVIAYVCTILVY